MPIIASYHNNEFMHTDVKAAQEFTILMGIIEIAMFVAHDDNNLTPKFAAMLDNLLKLFCKNTYILEFIAASSLLGRDLIFYKNKNMKKKKKY